MHSPSVSIVIPVFNCKAYIRECIDSVLSQSFTDYEIIAVFDGVTIEDYDCEVYLDNPKVIMKETAHVGVSESRNIGVSLAKGDFILFLDGDDRLKEGSLSSILEQMDCTDLDVLTFDADLFHDGGEFVPSEDNRYSRDLGVSGTMPGRILLSIMLNADSFRCPVWLLCIRRSFYISSGLCFYKGIIHEDELFAFVCLMEAERVKWVDDIVVQHRLRNDSIMGAGLSHLNLDGYVRVLVESFRYIERKGSYGIESKRFTYRLFTLILEKSAQLSEEELRCVSHLDKGSYSLLVENVPSDRWELLSDAVKHSLEPINGLLSKAIEDSDHPLVSVIMPVYNAEHYLKESLDDVLGQSVDCFELICIDDGSTDSSPEILGKYAEAYSNMRVFTQNNRFAGAARNKGMSLAKGDYLLFLDSDDRFERRMLESALVSALEHGSDIVMFEADVFDSLTLENEPAEWLLKTRFVEGDVFSPKDLGGNLFQMFTGVPWNKMFKKEFIKRTGLAFKEVPRSNDVFFVLSAISSAEKISVVRDVLVHYRRNNPYSLQGTLSDTPLAFYDAYYAVKQRLQEQGEYWRYRITFVNACIRNAVNNLQKLKDPRSVAFLINEFKEHIFKDLEIFDIPEEKVVYHKDYDILVSVRDDTIISYLESVGMLESYVSMIKDDHVECEQFLTMLWNDDSDRSTELLLSSDIVSAHYWKSKVYYYGHNVPKDFDKAESEARLSLVFGDSRVRWILFEILWKSGVSDVELSEMAGDDPWRKGRMYFHGRGVEQNYTVASEHLRCAAVKGVSGAYPLLVESLWNIRSLDSFRELVTYSDKVDADIKELFIGKACRILEPVSLPEDRIPVGNLSGQAMLISKMVDNGNLSKLDELIWILEHEGHDKEAFELKVAHLLSSE